MDPQPYQADNFGMAKAKEKQVVSRLKGPPYRPTFIRQWRKYRQLTQEQLCERIDMSTGNLSNIETGKQGYTQENLEEIADALDCEVVDLMMRDPSDTEGIWTLWERAKPADRTRILDLAHALVRKSA
jgi:transcriptional regulator with XRE-family HTH domain